MKYICNCAGKPRCWHDPLGGYLCDHAEPHEANGDCDEQECDPSDGKEPFPVWCVEVTP